MSQITSKNDLLKLIHSSDLLLCFFSSKSFWGSEDLLRKVDYLLLNYPKVNKAYIPLEDSPEICGEFSVFIAPTILIFAHGKESLRKSKFIFLNEIEAFIERYYSFINE